MPRTLPSAIETAMHLVSTDQAWLLFCEVERSDGSFHRLVRASRHVDADGHTWQACGFTFEPAAESAEGDLSSFSVGVPNVSRIAMRAMELDGELIGQKVRILLAYQGELGVGSMVELVSGECFQATSKEAAALLKCGEPGQSQRVPGRVFDRRTFPQILSGRSGQI